MLTSNLALNLVPILAVNDDPLIWAPCLVSGVATGVSVYWLLATLRAEDLEQDDQWRYDVSRINALRVADPFYRVFQIVIQGLAKINRAVFPGRLPEILRQVRAAGLSRGCRPRGVRPGAPARG